jgi:hypothetical protein
MRGYFGPGEIANHLLDGAMILGEIEISHACSLINASLEPVRLCWNFGASSGR